MPKNPGDKLACSIFAVGLSLGIIAREEVVRWADRRIEEIDKPPIWVIDLSLSHNRNLTDLISDLNEIGKGVDPVAVFEGALALLPDTSGLSFDEAESLANRIYHMARQCIGDWQNELMCKADCIDDTFALVRDGYSTLTPQQAIAELAQFIENHRDKSTMQMLFSSVRSKPLPTST